MIHTWQVSFPNVFSFFWPFLSSFRPSHLEMFGFWHTNYNQHFLLVTFERNSTYLKEKEMYVKIWLKSGKNKGKFINAAIVFFHFSKKLCFSIFTSTDFHFSWFDFIVYIGRALILQTFAMFCLLIILRVSQSFALDNTVLVVIKS